MPEHGNHGHLDGDAAVDLVGGPGRDLSVRQTYKASPIQKRSTTSMTSTRVLPRAGSDGRSTGIVLEHACCVAGDAGLAHTAMR